MCCLVFKGVASFTCDENLSHSFNLNVICNVNSLDNIMIKLLRNYEFYVPGREEGGEGIFTVPAHRTPTFPYQPPPPNKCSQIVEHCSVTYFI